MEKYLVASSGDTLDSKVSGRFGHSNYFLVIDPKTMEFEVFPGVGKDESQQIGRYINTGINKVIVGNIGPSAYNEVISFGCKVFLCRNMPVNEAVKQVMKGNVQPLKEPTLKDSIHSARKTSDDRSGRGEGSGRGKGLGLGPRDGRGMGRGQGGGMGGGRGRK